jgi:sugar phosphate isomerase/epimerase
MKIAAYLDDAGDTPDIACQTLQECGIKHVVIRQVWTGNICDLSDSTCQKLKNIIDKHALSVPMVASNLGLIDCNDLGSISLETINRTLSITRYFKANYVRIFGGIKNTSRNKDVINNWMSLVSSECAKAGIVPLFEIIDDFPYSYDVPIILELLNNNRHWRLLYDPVQLIIKRNVNPFDKYWKNVRKFVAAIDIRDYKIGHGFKIAGTGDSMIKQTIDDSKGIGYDGWYFMEFSLGKRISDGLSKQDIFKESYKQFLKITV